MKYFDSKLFYQILLVFQSSFVVDFFFGLFEVAAAIVLLVPVAVRTVVVLLPKRQGHFHNKYLFITGTLVFRENEISINSFKISFDDTFMVGTLNIDWRQKLLIFKSISAFVKKLSSFCSFNQFLGSFVCEAQIFIDTETLSFFLSSPLHVIRYSFSSERKRWNFFETFQPEKVKRKNRLQDYFVPLHNKVPICLSLFSSVERWPDKNVSEKRSKKFF